MPLLPLLRHYADATFTPLMLRYADAKMTCCSYAYAVQARRDDAMLS